MTKITSFFKPKGKPKSTNGGNGAGQRQRQSGTKRSRDDDNDNEQANGKKAAPLFLGGIGLGGGTAAQNLCPEAEELLQHLTDHAAIAPVEGAGSEQPIMTWRRALQRHVATPSFRTLSKFVSTERARANDATNRGGGGGGVYPPASETFASLNLTPLHAVRVVVVGQDPYHGYGQGHGLAFSVKRGVKVPPSLRNIYKELCDDPDVGFANHVNNASSNGGELPRHGNLERWARQGVLLLNSVLTVRDGEPNSHAKRGWEAFTDEVIRVLDRHHSGRHTGLVFLLWGRPASKKAENVIRGATSSSCRHTVICTSHPSPLGATKTKAPFLGSRCFSRANSALVENGMEPIDWNVDDPPPA